MTQSFHDYFSEDPVGYAQSRPHYPAALGVLLSDLAGGDTLAVDCGCGSGQLSVLLADHFGQVEALDASAAQISHARPHPRIRYRVAMAENTGVPDGAADLLAAAQAVHWFDLPAFWNEAARVVRPGGLVALVGYGVFRMGDAFDSLIDEFHDTTLGPYWPPQRRVVVGGYDKVQMPFAPISAPCIDMRLEWSLGELLGYLATWSAVRAMQRTTGCSPLPSFANGLGKVWGRPDEKRPVYWPLHLKLGRVQRESRSAPEPR